jgi:hypothetical protein
MRNLPWPKSGKRSPKQVIRGQGFRENVDTSRASDDGVSIAEEFDFGGVEVIGGAAAETG